MTRLLASVADLDELALAAEGGADILDLKDPTAGALGAWPPDRIAQAVALKAPLPSRERGWGEGRYGRRPEKTRVPPAGGYPPLPNPSPARGEGLYSEPETIPLSATVGDLPMDPAAVIARVAETWALGVDFVKIGLVPDGDPAGCVAALAAQTHRGARLIAVLFADLWADFRLLDDIARAGFAGAMLDTVGKASGGLLRHKGLDTVAHFVDGAHRRGLLSGLAGSLTLADVPALLPLGPDYLGFRTALCAGGDRRGVLDPAALAAVRLSIPPSRATGPIPASTAAGSPSSRHRPG